VRRLVAAAALVAISLPALAGATGQPLVQVAVTAGAFGVQAEPALAVDPTNDQVLLGGTFADGFDIFAMKVYSSADGGATWKTTRLQPPPAKEIRCAAGDPALAVAADGTQYYAFLFASCKDLLTADDSTLDLSIALARRAGATSRWTTSIVAPHKNQRVDDKPSLAVDTGAASPHRGRVYVAWSLFTSKAEQLVITHSDDGGATWAPLARIDDRQEGATFASIGIGPSGTVYVAWVSAGDVYVDRSDDGQHFGHDLLVDNAVGLPVGHCDFPISSTGIPAQPLRCITPAPLVAVDNTAGPNAGRVYVTYSGAGVGGKQQDVFVAAYDPVLQPLLGGRAARQLVNPPDGRIPEDQFLPASAVDQSNGDLWVCFYDTTGDRHRIKSWYTCTASADGGATWAKPLRAASVSSNETVRRASAFEFGDYEGLAVLNGSAHPFWTDSRDLATKSEEIYTTVLARDQLQLPQ
jgi:hypothetical protein